MISLWISHITDLPAVLPVSTSLSLGQLRRMLDGEQGAYVRSGSTEPVPPGYADAVAEYFRRLSKEK